MRIGVDAEGQPGDGGEHTEPAKLAGEVADLLVVEQDTPLLEQDGPVTFVGIDEWKDQGAGVGHVGPDIEKILEEPEESKGEAVGLAVEKEKRGAQERNEEFTKSGEA